MNDLNELLLTITKGNADSFKAGYEAGFKAAQQTVERWLNQWLAEVDRTMAQAQATQPSGPEVQEERVQGSGGEQVGMHNSLLDDEKFRQQVRDYVNGDTPFAPGGT